MAQDIYDNGPINGNTDAWTINFGFVVSDTFNVSNNNTTITGCSFGMWLFSGDTLTSAELSITSGENSGTSYFDQTVNFTQGACTSQPVRLQRLHREHHVQRPDAQCRHLLAEPAECQRTQRRPGLLGRELRPVAGLGELGWLDSFGSLHASRQRRPPPPPDSVPEPSSIMLFGSGILGLAGILRRKLF